MAVDVGADTTFSKMPPQNQEISKKLNVIEDIDTDDEIHAFSGRGCCFWIPCFGCNNSKRGSFWWGRIKAVDHTTTNDVWWTRGWKGIREWSELTAGPRWKTFIRTFRKKHQGLVIICIGSGAKQQPKFQYDPLSYSLNFDEGLGHNCHYVDEDLVSRDFSSRFASVPTSSTNTKSLSVDFGGKDAPPLHPVT